MIADTALAGAPLDAMRGSEAPAQSESGLRPDSVGVSRQQAVLLYAENIFGIQKCPPYHGWETPKSFHLNFLQPREFFPIKRYA